MSSGCCRTCRLQEELFTWSLHLHQMDNRSDAAYFLFLQVFLLDSAHICAVSGLWQREVSYVRGRVRCWLVKATCLNNGLAETPHSWNTRMLIQSLPFQPPTVLYSESWPWIYMYVFRKLSLDNRHFDSINYWTSTVKSWIIVNWTIANIFQWKFNQNTAICSEENAHENVVCEMASILSRPQWVNKTTHKGDVVKKRYMALQ